MQATKSEPYVTPWPWMAISQELSTVLMLSFAILMHEGIKWSFGMCFRHLVCPLPTPLLLSWAKKHGHLKCYYFIFFSFFAMVDFVSLTAPSLLNSSLSLFLSFWLSWALLFSCPTSHSADQKPLANSLCWLCLRQGRRKHHTINPCHRHLQATH